MIRGVFFDLWGTLVRDPSNTSGPRGQDRLSKVIAALESHGLEALRPEAEARLARLSTRLTTMHDIAIDVSAGARVDLFVSNLTPANVDLSPAARAALEAAITTIEPTRYPEPEPHARAALAALKTLGLGTGVISNAGFTTAPTLRSMLAHHELALNLDVTLFSDEQEIAKPARELFELAASLAGLAAEEIAFVGDTPWNDVQGAQSAGMFAVQIGRKERDGIRPDLQIDSLAELLPGLRGLSLLPD